MNNGRYSSKYKITIEMMRCYLTKNKWIENKNFKNKQVVVFEKTLDNKNFSVVIPAKEDYEDYTQRIYDTLNFLSNIEEKSISEIMRDIYISNYTDKQLRETICAVDDFTYGIPCISLEDLKKNNSQILPKNKNYPSQLSQLNFKNIDKDIVSINKNIANINEHINFINTIFNEELKLFNIVECNATYTKNTKKCMQKLEKTIKNVYEELTSNNRIKKY